ncbi:hypothetical protein NHX12_021012 [Muraenolepis orangiensis]|uniref:Uncharacterized protein n=1 Tax=Muraenolepis orangiensis TaxID=630683 RepID=A0A9Q0ESA8_9TELE|nr:hypothetical protein NHX12_021012 [Muraenolepis orangiensis]
MEGIENPAFDEGGGGGGGGGGSGDGGGGGSAETFASSPRPGSEIRGDRPDSTLVARPKNVELRAAARERGNERAQNDFDPRAAACRADPRRSGAAEGGMPDELELTMLHADENQLYRRMAELLDEDDRFIDLPGTPLAPSDEEVSGVTPGNAVLGGAWGPGVSPRDAAAQNQVWARVRGPRCYTRRRTIENQSQRVLGEGQEEVMVKYEQMTELPESSSPPPLWQEEAWREAPRRPVEVRVRCLRAVRDKLPRGPYSVSVSLRGRLGDPALSHAGPGASPTTRGPWSTGAASTTSPSTSTRACACRRRTSSAGFFNDGETAVEVSIRPADLFNNLFIPCG